MVRTEVEMEEGGGGGGDGGMEQSLEVKTRLLVVALKCVALSIGSLFSRLLCGFYGHTAARRRANKTEGRGGVG